MRAYVACSYIAGDGDEIAGGVLKRHGAGSRRAMSIQLLIADCCLG